MNRPRWRWWLLCVALEGHRILGWKWLSSVWVWCILPEWVHDGSPIDTSGEEPF